METDSDNPQQCTGCLLGAGVGLLFGSATTSGPDIVESSEGESDYEIIEMLGRGGMGEVHRARHRKLGREVALKTISADRLSKTAIERFKVEAAATARLQHANILPVHEFGEDRGAPYYTMRLIEGAADISRLRECPDYRHVAYVLAQVADGVEHAHQCGVLHRDLKPSNILLDDQDTPFVSDFGLAKLIGDHAEGNLTLTLESTALGSPSYMAPEQAGEGTIKTTSDVYGIGAILYDLLAGRPPFKGKSPIATIDLVQKGQLLLPSAYRMGIPPDLETICLKAMAREPEDRYASAADLAVDLRRFVSDQPILARPPSLSRRLVLLTKRHPAPIALASAALLALLLGITGTTWQWRKAVSQREAVSAEQAKTLNLLYHANMWVLDANQSLDAERIRRLLDEAASYPEHGFEWYYWQNYSRDRSHHTFAHHGRVSGAAFSPDGKFVATGSENKLNGGKGVIHIWDLATFRQLRTFEGLSGWVEHLLFTPDGSQLIAASANIISVWDMASGNCVIQFPHDADDDDDTNVSWLSLVPEAPSQIASCSWDRTIMIHDRTSGERLRQFLPSEGPGLGGFFTFAQDSDKLATHPGVIWDFKSGKILQDHGYIWDSIGRLAYSPNGQEIAFKGSIIDSQSGETVFAYERPDGHHHAAFSPDGHWFATDSDSKIWLRSMKFAASHRLFYSYNGKVRNLAFSPDGQWLLSTDDGSKARLWNRKAWDDSLPGHGSLEQEGKHRIPTVDISPDGRRIVTGSDDQRARVWDTDSRKLLLTVAEHQSAISAAVFLPNNREVLTSSNDSVAKVWDVTTGKVRLTLTEHTDELWCANVSHDGHFLVTGGRDKDVIVWDAGNGQKLRTLAHPDAVTAVAFSPDNTLIATGCDDKLARIWDAATGEERVVCQGHGSWVGELRFFPDGKHLLTGSADKTARVWDVATGELLRILIGHGDGVGGLAISPDGKRIFTGSKDGTIRVWDDQNLHHLLSLRSPYGPIHSLDLTPDGHTLVSAAHYAASIWEAPAVNTAK